MALENCSGRGHSPPIHDLDKCLLPYVADRQPAGEHTRPHGTVDGDRDLVLSTVTAQLRQVRLLLPHSTPHLPQPIDSNIVDSELVELSPGLLHVLAVQRSITPTRSGIDRWTASAMLALVRV